MRAVLIVNPTATSTTPAGRDLLAHALKSRLELTVEHTNHHGHGAELAQRAARITRLEQQVSSFATALAQRDTQLRETRHEAQGLQDSAAALRTQLAAGRFGD